MKYDLLGLGSVVLDRIAFTPRIIGPEEKIAMPNRDGSPFQDVIGGVTLNPLSWAHLLGLNVGVLAVGANDEAGRTLRQEMVRLGVEPLMVNGGSASAFSLIFVDPEGQRAIYMYRGTNAEVTTSIVNEHFAPSLASTQIFSTEISQLPLDAVVEGLKLARAAGATTAIDVDIPLHDALQTLGTKEAFEEALALSDIIKPTDAVLNDIAKGNTPLQRAQYLRSLYGAQVVAVTTGESGCAIVDDSFEGVVHPPPIKRIIDSTGAGDAFFGGLLFGVASGVQGRALGELGNACGGTCCEVIGAVPDSDHRLDSIRDRLPPALRDVLKLE